MVYSTEYGILQACRGARMDSGVEVADADVEETYENPDKIYRTAHEADILFAYSTVEGMRS